MNTDEKNDDRALRDLFGALNDRVDAAHPLPAYGAFMKETRQSPAPEARRNNAFRFFGEAAFAFALTAAVIALTVNQRASLSSDGATASLINTSWTRTFKDPGAPVVPFQPESLVSAQTYDPLPFPVYGEKQSI